MFPLSERSSFAKAMEDIFLSNFERKMAEREGFEPFSASKLSRLIHADLVDG